MATLVVFKFPTAKGANTMLYTLEGLQKQQLIQIQDELLSAGLLAPVNPRPVNSRKVLRPGQARWAYKYRFFDPKRGNVPAHGVFVVFGAPFPFAFSSSSRLQV